MSKLLIPNTCQVPNVIFDEVMRRISDPALRVLLAIVRKTYGFQKYSDTVSLTQLQKITGLSRQGVVNGIRALGSLVKIKRGGIEGNEYSLNLDVKTGELVNAVDQSMGLTSQRSVKTTSQWRRHTKPSKNKTQKPPDSFFPIIEKIIHRVNALSGRAYQANSKAMCKHLRARLKAGATEAQCLAVVDYRWQRWGDSEKMREHFNPVTLFREENFERYLAEVDANTNGNGHAKPAQVKDLGNGMVEVDGVQMDRRIYERRHGQRAN